MGSFTKIAQATFLSFVLAMPFCANAREQLLPPGFRPLPLGVHAIVGGKVLTKPGEVLEKATIVIRDGVIEKVGADLQPPADARVWDVTGLTIYPGFIDPYLSLSATRSAAPSAKSFDHLTSGKFFGVPGSELDPGNPGPGPDNTLMTPERRMAENYAPDAKLLEKLREIGFTAANVVPEKGIIRGTSAFVTLSDADPSEAILNADAFQHIGFDAEGRRENAYPDSLMGIIAGVRQTFFDAEHYALERAQYEKKPTGKRVAFNPSLSALQLAREKKMKVIFDPGSALMVDRAAQVAKELGLDFAVLASGEEWRRPDLAKATAVPFIVPLNFPEVSKMPEDDDWNQLSLDQLRAWDWAPENPSLLRAQGLEIALTSHGIADRKNFRRNLKGAIERGLSEADALAAITVIPAKLCGVEKLIGTIEPGKLANLTIVQGNYFDGEGKVRDVWIDGKIYRVEPAKQAKEEKKDGEKKPEDEKEKADKEKKEAERKALLKTRVARSPVEGRGPITNAANIVIRNATVWTCATNGILTNATIAVSSGKITAIGEKAEGAADALAIDGAGRHVTPGLIDCHNHSMILGSVNEATLPSTAMVRIGDVVNSETANIYEQLAGGLTIANLLHGSANPIGGQNQVIKLRDGASPERLKFEGAPPGIKFALGENVKQSNWGEKHTTRFPQSRMGVKTFLNNRFVAAQQYLRAWEKSKGTGLPPRRDLELETIGEIIQGKRWIHCHSYRSDEILMFVRLMEGFNVKIGTMQHVLEGYKVADELAAHGAGASTFADWWAYKFEVWDAIPHNAALMRDRGVLVSINSDSSDLARRLNTEAAKTVKYGNAPEQEALKFVTINPAKQLRIAERVGSLEPGKDADFVIWSGHPLSTSSICLQTWIEGQKYFDRDLSGARAEALENERKALVEKAKKVLNIVTATGQKPDDAGKKRFFERSLEHEHDGHVRHCDDDCG
jgi:imidazolonepropionase-like amidohydrolase